MTNRITRRRFFQVMLGGTLGLGSTAIGGTAYITNIEPYALSLSRLTVYLPNLPPAFDGFTIAQISDLHLGAWMTLDRMLAIANDVNRLNPDMIAVTGDFVSAIHHETPAEITQTLAALQAREGVFAILGNHDHWTHAPTVRAAIQRSGAMLLNNTHQVIQRGADHLYIAGVDDIWEHKQDLALALAGIPDGAATVLLAHEPDFADQAAATGRVGLQLSGHSHGGQVRLPGTGALILPRWGQKYDMGRYTVNGMTLYVNRGVGMSYPAVRFNCPPELTYITLTA